MADKKTTIIEMPSEEEVAAMRQELNKRFDAACEKSYQIIEDFVSEGYKDLLAKALAYLPLERQEAALGKVAPEIRDEMRGKLAEVNAGAAESGTDGAADVADGACSGPFPNTAVLSAAGHVLKAAGYYGEVCASEIISVDNLFDSELFTKDSERFFAKNPLLAMNTENFLFGMELITYLDDRAVQKWLREMDPQTLAKALKLVNSDVEDKVFRNMSKRAANMLKEDMEFMGPVRKCDIIEAQKTCLKTIRKLEKNGDIIVPILTAIYTNNDELIN